MDSSKKTQITLEEGKYYLDRMGRKVGPMSLRWSGTTYPWGITLEPFCWNSDGVRWPKSNASDTDLVEIFEEVTKASQPKLSGETIDMIAIDSLKWHFKDKDMEPLQLEAFRIVLRYYGVSV